MRCVVLAVLTIAALTVTAGIGIKRWRQQRDFDLAVRWAPETGLFDWGPASVRLPPGFTHQRLQGCDTLVGEIISRDGRVVIGYDIGELAGEHGGIGRFTESPRDGSRVRVSRSGEGAWFPDNGCARFYLARESREGLSAIQAIAASFQPRNRLPAWLTPLLPEFIRKDCRYRLPDVF